MDVSRIEPITPYKINWQKLTAKEIIKYEQQGIDVPTQYITWAQEFQKTLTDSHDETTYESATQKTDSNQSKMPENTDINRNITQEDDSNENQLNITEEEGGEQKTEAQLKHEQMIKDGTSIFKQAKTFRKISREKKKDMLKENMLMQAATISSMDEITKLDNYMNGLMKNIEKNQESMKKEIKAVNSGKGNLRNINTIQDQLTKLGNEGIQKSSETEDNLSDFDNIYANVATDIISAADYGVETNNIGREVIEYAKNMYSIAATAIFAIGATTVNAGNNAIKGALTTTASLNESKTINDINIQSTGTYKNMIYEATGIEKPEEKDNTNQEETENISEENKSNNIANQEPDENTKTETETENAAKGETESEKIATNDGSDILDKLNTDLNEILKRKIRRGEKINKDEFQE